MADKRSPRQDGMPLSKRAKNTPLKQHDNTTSTDELDYTITHSRTINVDTGSTSLKDVPVRAPESHSEATPVQSPTDNHGSLTGNDLQPVTVSSPTLPGGLPERPTHSIESTAHDAKGGLALSSPRLSDGSLGGLTPSEDQEDGWFEDYGNFVLQSPSPEIDLREELGPWSPPSEPLRPPNPYIKGHQFEIRPHKAPPPFGEDYADYPGLRDGASERDLRTKTLVELCLEHPPMAGETSWDDPPRTLHVIDGIRVRDDGGAQLLVCRLDDEEEEYAAKIYDPLYYGFNDRLWPENPRDVADEADKDYCREVAAYLELDDKCGGKQIPKYYGSWTFQIPLDLPDARQMRDVRLILMEHIKGDTMSEVDPLLYPEEVRLSVMAQMLEAYSQITFAGVSHGDIAQRNVMLCRGEVAKTIERVVLIDFNYAVVSRLDNFELLYSHRPKGGDKPDNPISQWWGAGGLYSKFGDWFPARWKSQRRPLREWLYERWGRSEEFLPYKQPLDWTDD
ncbi:hypothetical protein N0V82_004118 [Gnomoniopsis sp. IMI 355080]|nr:hypothetical protein N0V82_004118 [Gnomoniopsis sp. IMI 355080]